MWNGKFWSGFFEHRLSRYLMPIGPPQTFSGGISSKKHFQTFLRTFVIVKSGVRSQASLSQNPIQQLFIDEQIVTSISSLAPSETILLKTYDLWTICQVKKEFQVAMTKCLGEINFWVWKNRILVLIQIFPRLILCNSKTLHPIFMKLFFYLVLYINFTRFTGICDPIGHLFYRGHILLSVRVPRIRQKWMLQSPILITSLNTLPRIWTIHKIEYSTKCLLNHRWGVL